MSGSGLILGRSPAMWAAFLQALLNVIVGVFGIPLSQDQVIELNALGVVAIGLLANSTDPRTVPTLALTTRAPSSTPTTSSTSSTPTADSPSAMASSSGGPTGAPSGGDPIAPTVDPTAGDGGASPSA